MDQNGFDSSEILTGDWLIPSIDNVLFDIGLSLDSVFNDTKPRKLLHQPLFVLFFMIIFMSLKVATITVDTDSDELLNLLGGFTHTYGRKMKQNINIFFVLSVMFVFFSQWVYYQNHKRGIKPTFLRVFHMMSGSVSPREVGLTNEEDIRRLIRLCRRISKMIWINNNRSIITLAITYNLAGFYFKSGLHDTLNYGTPHAIIVAIWAHTFWNIFCYQFLYFYIICQFLRTKLKRINESVIRMKSGKQFIRIGSLLSSLNSLYIEINEYNTSYWSKFLLNVWLTFCTSIVCLLHTTVFVDLPQIFFVIFLYSLVGYWSLFLFIIFTASSVHSEANKSYKYLNSISTLNYTNRFRFKWKVRN